MLHQFHPLHVLPADPLGTLPRPLLRLIYPAQALSASPSSSRPPSPEPIAAYTREKNVSAAEKLRDQMRRDMLSEFGEEEDGLSTRVSAAKADGGDEEVEGVDWQAMVSPTKRVLAMEVRF